MNVVSGNVCKLLYTQIVNICECESSHLLVVVVNISCYARFAQIKKGYNKRSSSLIGMGIDLCLGRKLANIIATLLCCSLQDLHWHFMKIFMADIYLECAGVCGSQVKHGIFPSCFE